MKFLDLFETPPYGVQEAWAIFARATSGGTLTEGNLRDWAKRELELAGLFKKDSDYGGMLGDSVLKLIDIFAEEGHSGCSAAMASELFAQLSRWKPLTPITENPDEWMCIDEKMLSPNQGKLWQSKRRSSSFSRDGGKTWYDIDDPKLNNGDVWVRKA